MSIAIVFNELSVAEQGSPHSANEMLVRFIQVFKILIPFCVDRTLRIQPEFFLSHVAANYSIHDWTNDKLFDRDTRHYWKRIATKSPLIETGDSEYENYLTTDYFANGTQAIGLGVAHHLEGIAVSFNTNGQWQNPDIQLIRKMLDNDSNISEEAVIVKHAATEDHAREHGGWIDSILRVTPTSGQDIWKRRTELYPNLCFCDCVEGQLSNARSSQNFEKIHPILRDMDSNSCCIKDCLRKERIGRFRLSGESSSTNSDNRLRLERTFPCPDGVSRYFEQHIKASSLRIHFTLDENHILIGYIGKHLETSSDR